MFNARSCFDVMNAGKCAALLFWPLCAVCVLTAVVVFLGARRVPNESLDMQD